MSNTQKIQWKRLSVEAAAIVASILLAFAIDAWWDHRNDLISEVEILHSLQDEFTANHETLLQDIEYVRTYTEAIQRLLVAYEGVSVSRQSIDLTERYRPVVGRIIPIPSLEGAEREPPDPDSLRRLLESVEFNSLLSMRLDVSLVSLKDKNDTLAELNRILDLLKDAS